MNYFHMLQRREQILVISAGVLVLVLAVFTFVIDPILARAANLDRRLAAAGRQLADLQTLRGDYQRQKQMIDRIDAQLRRQQRNFAIFSHLEQVAGQTGIQDRIQSMNTVASPPNTLYRENSVEVRIEAVTLQQLVEYLHRVERSQQVLRIKRLQISPTRDNRQLLLVRLRVSVFSLAEPAD
jgi:general secretion pathway protein M